MSAATILRDLGVDPDAPASSLSAVQLVEAVARRLHPPTDPEPRWLPTRKAATYLGVSPATLRRYASESDTIERREGAGRAPDQYLVSSLDAYREAQRRDYSAAA
ncbi:MAG: hypothetical protein CMM84_03880 [Rhodothermaceae bacterium]|nr:hypothetical protein [Rhodothermaceae bacterium]MBC15357.1 hypothetical protein [Rhodothermaceae bacterium]